jgi:hypothetical protein
MISRRSFGVTALAFGATACAPLGRVAQHFGMSAGTIALRGSTTVPFTLSGNRIYIAGKLGNSTYAFIFDTGGAAILTPDVQRERRFPVLGATVVKGVGDSEVRADIVQVPQASVGSATYSDGAFVVLSPAHLTSSPIAGLVFGGILGREFFMKLITTIDYEKQTLTFYEPSSFQPDAGALVLPLTMRNGVFPNVEASVDGHPGNFDLDAGSSRALTLTQVFSQSIGAEKNQHSIDVVVGRGTGGMQLGTASRVENLTLGSLDLRSPIAMVANSTGGVFAEGGFSGNIGSEVLQRFTLTLDVPNAKLYLVPNSKFGKPFTFNRSGIFSDRAADNAEDIVLVVSASPAAKAGIRVGDRILSIDGVDVSSWSHERVDDVWHRDSGTLVMLRIKRDGQILTDGILLRDLL